MLFLFDCMCVHICTYLLLLTKKTRNISFLWQYIQTALILNTLVHVYSHLYVQYLTRWCVCYTNIQYIEIEIHLSGSIWLSMDAPLYFTGSHMTGANVSYYNLYRIDVFVLNHFVTIKVQSVRSYTIYFNCVNLKQRLQIPSSDILSTQRYVF